MRGALAVCVFCSLLLPQTSGRPPNARDLKRLAARAVFAVARTDTTGNGRTIRAIPIDPLRALLEKTIAR
jgi:hypothetical protein